MPDMRAVRKKDRPQPKRDVFLGAELLIELISQRYKRASTLTTRNLPFEEWTEAHRSERLNGALLKWLHHHVSILSMNGESYHLAHSRKTTPNN